MPPLLVPKPARTRNLLYASGLLVVAGVFACAPLLLRRPDVNLTSQPTPLQPSQIMRGAYLNTGSRDMGADPAWVNGKYVGPAAPHFAPTADEVAAARARLDARRAAAGLPVRAPPPAPPQPPT